MMLGEATPLTVKECRVARRLARLFRVEHSGALARRPKHVVRHMVDRRARLIDELLRLEECRRSLEPMPIPELDGAMRVLARAVNCMEQHCLERLAAIGEELRRRRGIGTLSGLRDSGSGQLLGQG
jgi:hypothetical protein